MRNGVYCCVIHERKYIVDTLCTVITLLNNEINLYMKKCFPQAYITFKWEAKWTQTGTRFHFHWKSHFGVQSCLYFCSHKLSWNETENGTNFISVILTEIKFQTGMRFSCEQNLSEPKWISADSLDIAFNAHVRLKPIASMGYISVIYICPSKYRVVLKCSQNESSCEQNLFSRRFEVSNRYEFISPLMWTYSYTIAILHF